ncbi:hypothetical protein EAG_05722 [Camponotus floridanus]|uniref:Uncharacterized protein n=1 Tax=Camponotus floridanus TaxID=104421 RepID=E2AN15_CAMFO|nr:hypothetical protein EAG_05722 [Camponotus floridanus]
MFSNEEYRDMHYLYGLCDGNAAAAELCLLYLLNLKRVCICSKTRFNITNTFHRNIATILHCNISTSGHFTVAAILQQCCSNILQPFCNVTILQRNMSAMLLQYFCAVWNFIRMAPVLNTLVHLISLILYGFTLYYAFNILHIPMVAAKFEKFDPGQLKYLTMWDVRKDAQDRLQPRRRREWSVGQQHHKLTTFNRQYVHSQRLLANSREMREGLAIGFHAVTFLQFAFAVFYDYTYTIVPYNVTRVHRAFGGKFKFLTFWDAVIQTSCSFDIFPHNNYVLHLIRISILLDAISTSSLIDIKDSANNEVTSSCAANELKPHLMELHATHIIY